MLNETELYLESQGYKPIDCLESLGKPFKWYNKFRQQIVKNFSDLRVVVWVKVFFKDDDECWISMFVVNKENGEIVDAFLRPNEIYLIRDKDDLEILRFMFDEFNEIYENLSKTDVWC